MSQGRPGTETPLNGALVGLALLNAVIVVALFASAIAAGISQEPFQVARLADANAQRLLLNPAGLRINVGIDNGFIVAYCAFFALLAVRFRSVLGGTQIAIALGAILLTALLDAIENHHILAMLYSAERNLPLSAGESQWQMVASNVKFQASYVSIALFAFGFWRMGRLGRLIAATLALVYIPLGLAIFMVPPELARPLIISRTLFFIASFLAIAVLFSMKGKTADP